ncbi:MBL fold metallo-hydrolase [Microcella frigidaquae]|uniref:L-ascorbate metabolism protein UlaG (Beta-lactamase superfamily) n=1 Tax=Microcella frigidaquae TaxID=424758 RepID=A0A840X5L9_9MICO|nr:MBL fold metallo-hydrolase [Microcella frigidaquae]MBB5617511.1 L-ascorbate metabolism protein UlaG (beta-lactamase superfamily) [Microcella frigidaquae]NHN45380.1 MBL fold metallo-hydrolase [Microcella frigidaquae]
MTTISASIAVTVVGGPTALLEWAGLRLLLDPTFDEPRRYGDEPDALEKTAPPAVAAADLGHIDAALVSHHHHEDNLDLAGRDLAISLPLVVTTAAGARDLAARGGTARVIGLDDDEAITLDDPTVVGSAVADRAPEGARLIALPAQHGPDQWAERLGPVCGFLLHAPGQPTVYVSGDNSEVTVVEAVAARYGHVDAALLFAGAARVDDIDAPLTLTAERARAAALALGARRVVGLHVDQWTHFSEGRDALEREFAGLNSSAGGPLLAATPLGVRTEVAL